MRYSVTEPYDLEKMAQHSVDVGRGGLVSELERAAQQSTNPKEKLRLEI
jgi:hypothetical protein